MTDDREDRIRARAQALWESEGRPEGRHEHHWRQASEELDRDEVAAHGGAPAARSLGSAAQSDLIPEDAALGSRHPGSLVDTGPTIGLAAGGASLSGGGLGNLSLGTETDLGAGDAGGMGSIGEGTSAEAARARRR